MRSYGVPCIFTCALLIWHSGFAMESLILQQTKQQKQQEIALRKKIAEFNVQCPVTQETLLPEELQLSIASAMIGDFLSDTADELRESMQVGDDSLGKLLFAEISRNGSRLVTVHEPNKNTAYIWNMATTQLIHTLDDHEDTIAAAMVSPNSEQLLISLENGVVKIWNITTGTLKHTFPVSTDSITLAEIDSDNGYLVTVSASQEGVHNVVQIWSMETGDFLRTLEHLEYKDHCILSVAIRLGCKQLVTNSCNYLRLWNMEAGKLVRTLAERTVRYVCPSIAITCDDNYVIGGCDNQVTLWHMETGQCFTFTAHDAKIKSLFISLDNKLVTMASDGVIKVWDMAELSMNWLGLLHVCESGRIVCVPGLCAFDGYGKKFLKPLANKSVQVCDIETGKSCYLQGHKDEVGVLGINSAGTQIVTGSSAKVAKDTTTKIWSLKKSSARLWLENDILPFQANLIARIYATNKINGTFTIHSDTYDRWLWVSFPKHVRDYLNLYLQVELV